MSSTQQQVFLIVGAAGGLGSSLADQLALQTARNGRELQLILLDKNQRGLEQVADRLESEYAFQPVLMPLDLSGAAASDYDQMAQAIEAQFGQLDGVAFCAAQFPGLQPQAQVHSRDWLLQLQANLGAYQCLLQAHLGLLNAAEHARVVFCRNATANMDNAYWGAYGVAQPALEALANQWAAELSNTAIRVCLCLPPAMRTGLRAVAWPATEPEQWQLPDQCASRVVEWMLTRDMPDELQRLDMSQSEPSD